MLQRVERGGTHLAPKPENYSFPSFGNNVCELPLVVELSIRTGHAEQLFQATARAKAPTRALAIMMIHSEEIFALQWNLFSNDQLGHIYEWLKPLRVMADKQTHSSRGTRGKMVENSAYDPGREGEANQIVDSIDRTAGY